MPSSEVFVRGLKAFISVLLAIVVAVALVYFAKSLSSDQTLNRQVADASAAH